jgi:hypothetical protein
MYSSPNPTLTQECKAADVFDSKKMFFYLDLVLSTIATHCSEGEGCTAPSPAELLLLAQGLAEARAVDPTCIAPMHYAINFAQVARELRVASGTQNELEATGDGGQVVRDILARMGIPAGLFVSNKRSRGERAQRRGARILVMRDGWRERAPRHVTRKDANAELAKRVASGEIDIGRKFPPRLFIEIDNEDGTTTTKPYGACGRITNLKKRITHRIKAMTQDWLVAWPPAFESMDKGQVSQQLAQHGMKAMEQAKGKGKGKGKENGGNGGNGGGEESLESARTRLHVEWLWRMSDRSKTVQEWGGKCLASCDQCEVAECCSAIDCGKSKAVWACECGEPSVMRCGRCGRLGRGSANDVRDALRELSEEVPPTWSERQSRDRLVQLERMHHVSQRLKQLGQPAWLASEGAGPHSPLDLQDGVREARLLKAQMAVQFRIALWADGSPMLNKPWQLCTWSLLYDPLLFVHGLKAERECRRYAHAHTHAHMRVSEMQRGCACILTPTPDPDPNCIDLRSSS